MDPEILDDLNEEKTELASRGSRLAAAIVDSIILMPISFFVMYFYLDISYYLEQSDSDEFLEMLMGFDFYDTLLVSLPSILGYIVINYFTMEKYGQSLGKRLLNIKMVTLEDDLPSIRSLVVERYLLIQGIGMVPGVGGLFALVDVLLIFGKERRCIHDIIARTKVVKA
ncbi:MAG: hypothetical protein SchgKO_21080 [Schleiferiaceae bacterium]